jgi:DNA-binding winged helix-turn-helix (wHTH) protein
MDEKDLRRYFFGPFCVDQESGRLIKDGRVVPLSPKAVEILALLASRQGHVVSKAQIKTEVWPGVSVDDKNVIVQLVAIRKALSDSSKNPQYIETIPRRGYRLRVPARAEAIRAGLLSGPVVLPAREFRLRANGAATWVSFGCRCCCSSR